MFLPVLQKREIAMEVVFVEKITPYAHEVEHWLTYAEEGFAPLNIRTAGRLSNKVLRDFADQVNQSDESGSLHPKAPVSAIPRRLVRSCDDAQEVVPFILDFFKANASHIKAGVVALDFNTGRGVAPYLLEAARLACSTVTDGTVKKCYVMKDLE